MKDLKKRIKDIKEVKNEYLKALGINIEEVNKCTLSKNYLLVKFEDGHSVKFKITKPDCALSPLCPCEDCQDEASKELISNKYGK